MSSQAVWCDALQSAAGTRNVDISAIETAVRTVQDGSLIESWVHENLIQSKPLTTEELIVWNFLSERSIRHQGDVGTRVPNCAPVTEEALQQTIRDLETSTKLLEISIHALESQKNLLSTSDLPPGVVSSALSSFGPVLINKDTAQSQQLASINRELFHELEERSRLSRDRVDRQRRAISSIVTEKLKTDNRNLESLENSLSNASSGIGDSTHLSNKSNYLIPALCSVTIRWLRTRLDRVYIQELISSSSFNGDGGSTFDDAQIKQIEHDLQSLYTEIEDVASMLTENDHGNDLKRLEREAALHAAITEAGALHEAVGRLDGATSSLNTLAQQYESLQAHRHILSCIEESLSQAKRSSILIGGSSRPAQKGRHPSISRMDQAADQPDQVHALLHHMNVGPLQELFPSGPNIKTTLQNDSVLLAQGSQNMIQALITTARRSTTTAQKQLRYLSHAESVDHLGEAVHRITELDELIAAVRNEVGRDIGVASHEVGVNEECTEFARKFVRNQLGGVKHGLHE